MNQVSIEITEPEMLTGNLFITQEVSCFGFSDGSVSSFIQGGVTPIPMCGIIHPQRLVCLMFLLGHIL